MNAERTRAALRTIHDLSFRATLERIGDKLGVKIGGAHYVVRILRKNGLLAPKVKGEVGYTLTDKGQNLLFCK